MVTPLCRLTIGQDLSVKCEELGMFILVRGETAADGQRCLDPTIDVGAATRECSVSDEVVTIRGFVEEFPVDSFRVA